MIQESTKRAHQTNAAGLAAPIHGSRGSPPRHAPKQALSTKTQRRRPRHRHHPLLPKSATRPFSQAHNAAERLPLDEGLRFERERFEALFDTHDQEEGMIAFLEKRPPVWRHR